jgi:hypothetical protein
MTLKPPTITNSGKQVLLDGVHFADAATVYGAERIVAAMSNRTVSRAGIAKYIEDEAEKRRNPSLRRIMRVIAGNVRAGFDEVEQNDIPS